MFELFPAVADGVPGHYVATVTFPADAGTYRWRAHMDWFGVYELGSISVASATPPLIESSGGSSIWPDLRWVTLAASVVLGGVAVVDVLVTRRRRRSAPA